MRRQGGGKIINAKYHSADGHMYVRLKLARGAVSYLPLRNLVAAEWLDGAYELLEPGLTSHGTQRRDLKHGYRVYHRDSNQRNCAVHNLVVCPLHQPPAPLSQPLIVGAAPGLAPGAALPGGAVGGQQQPVPERRARSAAVAVSTAIADLAASGSLSGRGARRTCGGSGGGGGGSGGGGGVGGSGGGGSGSVGGSGSAGRGGGKRGGGGNGAAGQKAEKRRRQGGDSSC